MSKHLVVVDVESTGLVAERHVPLEVAAINVTTGEELYFVPFLHPEDLANAEPEAMQLNRYFERGVWRLALPQAETETRYRQLFDMLSGNTFGGANARFDAEMVRYGYARARQGVQVNRSMSSLMVPDETWHHRLSEVQSYYCGVMGTDPAEPPSLIAITEQLGLMYPEDQQHSALADARVTAEAYRRLKTSRTATPDVNEEPKF
ncbi:DnaQ-like exonuclease [Mycobacterium phage Bipper]|uniref:DnaQ exonuclease n=1 Tax=Mycobacterium phage Bipper TaxID=1805457 RepID=A0A142F2I2_9CAUD|nr:DnaQ exonuclease [Mycobacterium phage Bipper]AMQ66989.1 DnaQ-like exonuclease [Mycobacterium phage Bipper]